jgi:hypothetical protein
MIEIQLPILKDVTSDDRRFIHVFFWLTSEQIITLETY